jgi:LDH2 family malate/lactate/ureidoglycolate dehydrogenase
MDNVIGQPGSVTPEALGKLVSHLFEFRGVPREDAELIADSLVQSDLWGHQSHGVLRAPWYLERLRTGVMQPAGRPEIVVDAGAIAVMDAKEGIGQVTSVFAIEEAVRRAKLHGMGAVSVRNSNHFGTCMYYTLRAAQAGCIGFATTNGGPAMPPTGGLSKLVGTNPFSFACPAGRHSPMMLDIANTAVARGKIYLARNKGETIPPGWAMTIDGEPTTDPQKAIDGIILPMAGHKGYGIGLMMDVLSGVLSGSRFLDGVNGPYKYDKTSGAGHLFMAFDIPKFRPLAEFEADMEVMIGKVKASPLAKNSEGVFYPGEIEAMNDRKYRAAGLTLARDTIADLEREVELAGLGGELPWTR